MAIDLGKQTGKIKLDKGQRVSIDKTAKGLKAICRWPSGTDYDVYAVVLFKDGHQEVCSTFGSQAQPAYTMTVAGGAIRHQGDVKRSGGEEVIFVTPNEAVDQIAVVAYSAQSNGTGSFYKYRVTLEVDNYFGTAVTVPADRANRDNRVYTCVPAVIHNTDDGFTVERVEMYSQRNSELRPAFVGGVLVMDAGSKNLYK